MTVNTILVLALFPLVGGNFIGLLNYRVSGVDKALEEHLKTHNKNASYIIMWRSNI